MLRLCFYRIVQIYFIFAAYLLFEYLALFSIIDSVWERQSAYSGLWEENDVDDFTFYNLSFDHSLLVI